MWEEQGGVDSVRWHFELGSGELGCGCGCKHDGRSPPAGDAPDRAGMHASVKKQLGSCEGRARAGRHASVKNQLGSCEGRARAGRHASVKEQLGSCEGRAHVRAGMHTWGVRRKRATSAQMALAGASRHSHRGPWYSEALGTLALGTLRPLALGTLALGTPALGALALDALCLGALALGTLTLSALALGMSRSPLESTLARRSLLFHRVVRAEGSMAPPRHKGGGGGGDASSHRRIGTPCSVTCERRAAWALLILPKGGGAAAGMVRRIMGSIPGHTLFRRMRAEDGVGPPHHTGGWGAAAGMVRRILGSTPGHTLFHRIRAEDDVGPPRQGGGCGFEVASKSTVSLPLDVNIVSGACPPQMLVCLFSRLEPHLTSTG
eukprot:365974-Chlamydomonas_euryale.AAC.4